jgi:gliding motility-associated-like protein
LKWWPAQNPVTESNFMLMRFRHILTSLMFLLASAGASSQIVYPPYLHCVSVDNNGDIRLDWGLPVNTCGPFSAYYVLRSNNLSGPYSIVATILNQLQTSYTDPVGNGGSTTYYYYLQSDHNCPGATVLHSDTLDNLDPAAPVINVVTVVADQAHISWQPSPSPETFGYIIYRVMAGSYVPIDTVFGQQVNSYTDLNSMPSQDTMSYTLAAIDSCINTGLINEAPQHTILLEDTVIRCAQSIILNWSRYDRWPSGVEEYQLLVSVNGAPPVLYQTYGSNIFRDTVTGFNDGDLVCMTIAARQKNGVFISTSNEICVTLNVVQKANDFYVRGVSVVAPNEVEVRYSVDPLADLKTISIERAVDTISFTPLATFTPPADLSVINSFIDTTALTSSNAYYYRLVTVDSCNAKDTSGMGRTILLQGYAFSNLSYYLSWNPSYLDYGKVISYRIYRNDGSGFNLLATLGADVLSYEEGNLPETSVPCYYVEAIDSMIFPNGVSDTIHSRSNEICLNQPSQIYMPNAFAPLGKNNSFIPMLNVDGVKTYSFIIFNRWGEQIFFSNNPSDGWDGKFKGVYVQQGAYAYVVDVTDEAGKRIQKKGTVMVIR